MLIIFRYIISNKKINLLKKISTNMIFIENNFIKFISTNFKHKFDKICKLIQFSVKSPKIFY